MVVFGENYNEKLHVDIECVLIVTIGIQTGYICENITFACACAYACVTIENYLFD